MVLIVLIALPFDYQIPFVKKSMKFAKILVAHKL